MPSQGLSLVKIRAEGECFTLPATRVILCPRGLFTPDRRLPSGTPVVVQLCGEFDLTLRGIVRTDHADSGLTIEFAMGAESLSQRLAALLGG